LVKEQLKVQEQPAALSTSLRWQLGFSFTSFILMGANDGAGGVLLPFIRDHYGVDKGTISFIFLAGSLGYLLSAFNSGPLVGKLGYRIFLVVGTGSFLAGATLYTLIPPFAFILLAAMAVGFGIGCLDAGLNAYIAGLPNNTTKLNYLHAFFGIGAWLGPIIASGLLAAQFGWNIVYLVWIALDLVVLLGFALTFGGQRVAPQPADAPRERSALLSALKLRVVWLGAVFLCVYVGTEISMGSWTFSFLTEERHGSTLISGWAVSGYWFGLTLGRLTLANLARKFGNKRLIQGCLVGVVVGLLVIWLAPVTPAVTVVEALGLVLTGYCLGPIFPTTIAVMSELVEARLLPSAIGFIASLASLGGALFPGIAGNLAQQVGLWSLLPYVMLLTCILFFIWLALQARPVQPGVAASQQM
jgi:fucose permease